MRDQAGHQERSLKEIQSLVWAREQQIWDMEQLARISQENYQKQIAALQAELQKHEEANTQWPVRAIYATPPARSSADF